MNLSDVIIAEALLGEGGGSSVTGLTDDIKEALLACFENVAWINDDGQDYYDALETALYPPANLVSISAVLNASGHTFYVGDNINDIKNYLTVTATYEDSSTAVIPSASYTLSGSLSETGSNTITVSYGGKTTTVSVTAVGLDSISAVYTQSGTVYDTDTLDSLKSDLVVTAVYSDSSTETVASNDYTLSGTLTEGTSTITVSYGGETTTFNVTVSATSPIYYWDFRNSAVDTIQGAVFNVNSVNASLTSDGLYVSSYVAGLSTSGDAKIPLGGRAVIEFGTMDVQTGGHSNKGIMTNPALLMWRDASNKFSTWYNNAWADSMVVDITDKNYFSNKTLEITISDVGTVTYICDGTTIMELPLHVSNASSVAFASSSSNQSFSNMYIKTLAIYGGE